MGAYLRRIRLDFKARSRRKIYPRTMLAGRLPFQSKFQKQNGLSALYLRRARLDFKLSRGKIYSRLCRPIRLDFKASSRGKIGYPRA